MIRLKPEPPNPLLAILHSKSVILSDFVKWLLKNDYEIFKRSHPNMGRALYHQDMADAIQHYLYLKDQEIAQSMPAQNQLTLKG